MKIDFIISALLDEIAARNPYATDERERRAVDRYALDILATYQTMTRRADIDSETREQLKRALLIGATDWNEYARAGYALYHADAIAARIGRPADENAETDYLRAAFERIADTIQKRAANAA